MKQYQYQTELNIGAWVACVLSIGHLLPAPSRSYHSIILPLTSSVTCSVAVDSSTAQPEEQHELSILHELHSAAAEDEVAEMMDLLPLDETQAAQPASFNTQPAVGSSRVSPPQVRSLPIQFKKNHPLPHSTSRNC